MSLSSFVLDESLFIPFSIVADSTVGIKLFDADAPMDRNRSDVVKKKRSRKVIFAIVNSFELGLGS